VVAQLLGSGSGVRWERTNVPHSRLTLTARGHRGYGGGWRMRARTRLPSGCMPHARACIKFVPACTPCLGARARNCDGPTNASLCAPLFASSAGCPLSRRCTPRPVSLEAGAKPMMAHACHVTEPTRARFAQQRRRTGNVPLCPRAPRLSRPAACTPHPFQGRRLAAHAWGDNLPGHFRGRGVCGSWKVANTAGRDAHACAHAPSAPGLSAVLILRSTAMPAP
jgi:hypothetical protein